MFIKTKKPINFRKLFYLYSKKNIQLKDYLIKQFVIIITLYPHILLTFLLLLFLNPIAFLINFIILLLQWYTKFINNLSFCDGPIPTPATTIPVHVQLERFEIITAENVRLNVQIIVIPNRPLIINVWPVDPNLNLILEPM